MKRERAQETNITKLVKSTTSDEKQVKEKVAKLKAKQDDITSLEATVRTLLSTNALFLGVSYLLGFYFLLGLPILAYVYCVLFVLHLLCCCLLGRVLICLAICSNMLVTGAAANAALFYVSRKAK